MLIMPEPLKFDFLLIQEVTVQIEPLLKPLISIKGQLSMLGTMLSFSMTTGRHWLRSARVQRRRMYAKLGDLV